MCCHYTKLSGLLHALGKAKVCEGFLIVNFWPFIYRSMDGGLWEILVFCLCVSPHFYFITNIHSPVRISRTIFSVSEIALGCHLLFSIKKSKPGKLLFFMLLLFQSLFYHIRTYLCGELIYIHLTPDLPLFFMAWIWLWTEDAGDWFIV